MPASLGWHITFLVAIKALWLWTLIAGHKDYPGIFCHAGLFGGKNNALKNGQTINIIIMGKESFQLEETNQYRLSISRLSAERRTSQGGCSP